ncbi:MAG: type IV pilus assembly protein PilM [Candidatus Marinimicrobia bacterium]|jgi:type IV pilus assembly protein PilM|nr:type IV pilus assembly protein PilM [Candidatus Neomarinimicrobiota bacterium]MBT3502372.1 type IV pilus assembly protein PilM [Candidatus Neomarinimicrobiota bacterium]MBT3839342.1 type IV pilus assembly protein PilM [Candidatus Neomarinimicrobiota bacterium]MBT4000418.1 type IV pilus assembly protein PilM [Candidatus Neomarinimicrobiota bacterium]MBT4283550.1 type IV pilus assembly protein PilM [Candidatus Neomarinimicrobiota bacterium]
MYLGLDIGRQYIKMVSVEKTKDGFKILDAGARLVPEPNTAFDPEKIDKTLWVMAVKELFKQQGLNPKKIKGLITGISGSSASVKQITTMEMPTDELKSAMTFEARKHIPMDGTDAVIDFQILGSNEREMDKIDVGLVACTKGALNLHMDLIKECGLKPGIVDVNPIAMSNAFSFIKELPDDGLVVVLDIGAVSSTLVVYGKGKQFFTRDLPIGGHHFVKELANQKDISYTDAQDLHYKEGVSASIKSVSTDTDAVVGIAEKTVYDNLVEDLRRSLRFYAKQTGQSFFLKIFLSGGSGNTPGLTDFIHSKLNIECAVFDPFENMAGAEDLSVSNSCQYTTALGLGIRGGMVNE